MFSREHYESIALVVSLIKDYGTRFKQTEAYIDLFRDDNPRFKPDLFTRRVEELADKRSRGEILHGPTT